jgi:hypothetical protein
LDAAVAVQYAVEHGYTDMEILSFMAHGYPGPQVERCTVLGPPHVGTLKEPAAFLKMAAKDLGAAWVFAPTGLADAGRSNEHRLPAR